MTSEVVEPWHQDNARLCKRVDELTYLARRLADRMTDFITQADGCQCPDCALLAEAREKLVGRE